MDDKLWSKVRHRNALMEIAEEIAPIFKSRKIETFNEIIRFISVKNIEFTTSYLGEIVQFDLKIEFLSDQGSWIQLVIVRQYNSQHLFDAEIDSYNKTEMITLFNKNINLLSILKIEEDRLQIIFEGTEGEHLDKIQIDEEIKDFQVGVLAAILHGYEPLDVDTNHIKSIMSYLLNNLPFDTYTKEIIEEYLEYHYQVLGHSRSGYNSSTPFDIDRFGFTPIGETHYITKSKILRNEGFLIDILVYPGEDVVQDRMMDIASYYAETAFIEYINNKSVSETLNNILTFFEGYEFQLSNQSEIHLEQLYPSGLTLDLHMLLIYWLFVMDGLNASISENRKTEIIQQMIEYSYFLLISKPFQLYRAQVQIQDN